MLLRGAIGPGLGMLLGSFIPIILFALPAWNGWRRSERIEAEIARQAQSQQQQAPSPEPAPTPQAVDEYDGLRQDFRGTGRSRAGEQLELLLDKQRDFETVLNRKFSRSEVTYHRYQDSGQKVFDGAMRNLESIAAFARSVRSVNADALVEQLDQMIALGDGQSKSAVAIRERLEMMADGNKHIDALLGANEEALTALTRVTTRLAGIQTGSASEQDMDAMIRDLHEMAERTERYSEQIGLEAPTIKLS